MRHVLIAVLAAVALIAGLTTGGGAAVARSRIETVGEPSRISRQSSAGSSLDEAAGVLSAVIAGKRGSGLAAALRRECRPSRLCDYSSVYEGTTSIDPFTGNAVRVAGDLASRGLVTGRIVPSEWWTDLSLGADNLYGDTVGADLHNLALMQESVRKLAGTYPPGEPETLTADHQSWRQGTVSFSGISVAVNEPHVNQRGRVARTYLYMALMYPQKTLTPEGLMVMSDGGPGLNPYWCSLLLDWHKSYPAGDDEKMAASIAMDAQGGCNPFILLPELADYIWGEKSGQVYGGSGNSDMETPLHGTYTLTDRIALRSPYIPDDALWRIDGQLTVSDIVSAATLGAGEHSLEYTSETAGEHGIVKIIIER